MEEENEPLIQEATSRNEQPPVNSKEAETQQAPQQEDVSLGDMPSIFNTTKPKDIRDGLGNGLSNVLKGSTFCFFLTWTSLLKLIIVSIFFLFCNSRCSWRCCTDRDGKLCL